MDPGSPPADAGLGTQPQPQPQAAAAADLVANSKPASRAFNKLSTVEAAAEALAGLATAVSCSAVHCGWDISGVSTAKCDLCHQQRCGAIQKCRECKLSVCKPCSLAGRLDSDPRHALDPAAVSWAVPPSAARRRKAKAARDGVAKTVSAPAAFLSGAARRRASDQGCAAVTSRSSEQSSAVRGANRPLGPMRIREAGAGESPLHNVKEERIMLPRGHPGPAEPRISVGPTLPKTGPFAPPTQPQAQDQAHAHAAQPSALPPPWHSPTATSGNSQLRPAGPGRWPDPLSSARSSSSGVRGRSRRRSDSLLSRPGRSPDPLTRKHQDQRERELEHEHEHEHEHFHEYEYEYGIWPSRRQVEALGSRLANSARDMLDLRPSYGLGNLLRDEVQHFWLTAQEHEYQHPHSHQQQHEYEHGHEQQLQYRRGSMPQREQEPTLRLLIAAMPVAASYLGLRPDNAAKQWLDAMWAELERVRAFGAGLRGSVPADSS